MSNRPKPDNFFACGASFGRDNTLQLQYIRDLHQARSPSIGVLADGAAANPDAPSVMFHFTNSPPVIFVGMPSCLSIAEACSQPKERCHEPRQSSV
jgi:hypothetical protein